jgi:hypothetical protein
MFKISKIKNMKNNEKSVNIFGLAPFSFGRTTEVPPTVTICHCHYLPDAMHSNRGAPEAST